jgi:hypothetical protein
VAEGGAPGLDGEHVLPPAFRRGAGRVLAHEDVAEDQRVQRIDAGESGDGVRVDCASARPPQPVDVVDREHEARQREEQRHAHVPDARNVLTISGALAGGPTWLA